MSDPRDSAATFAPHRARLVRIAYRMLGSVAEAEDMVQEAYLRWHQADRAAVANAQAFLSKVVTRLCLDHLKSARVQRETYIGPWLPEPVVEQASEADADDLTFALMTTLERLSPLERAAFLLHDVFGMEFDEVAAAIERDPAACRQLASRARSHVRAARPRFPVSPEQGRDIANAFFAAARQGDMAGLQRLLADDVIVYSDGGGKKMAARKPIVGRDKVLRLFEAFTHYSGYDNPQLLHDGDIDGLPGFVTREQDGTLQTMAFDLEEGRISTIYVVRNPDKLRHLQN